MSNNLVIVESPAKAKTIQKYLGNGYEVIASMGHVRDLPKSKLGVDVENSLKTLPKKATKFTLQLTLTERARLFHGISHIFSNLI